MDIALTGDGAGELEAVLVGLGHRCVAADADADLIVLVGCAATVEAASTRRSVPVLVVADDASLLPLLAACPVDEVMLRSAAPEELAALDSAKRAGDEVYRYGGDEFACILTGQSLHGGRLAAERLRLAVRDLALPHDANQPSGVVTVSGGVAAAPAGARRQPEELVEEAEAALRRAKELGRDQVALGA